MEIIGQLVSDVVKCLAGPLFKPIGYTRNLQRKFDDLNKKSSELYDRRSYVTYEINKFKEEKIPKHECKGWLEQVEKIEKEVNTIKDEYNGAKKWFNGCCLNIKARWKVGKHMAEISNQTDALLVKSKLEGGFLVDAPPKIATEIPLPDTLVQKPIACTSEKVLGSMREVGIKRIGIWGMRGVGKTTILKSLNNREEMTSMFDFDIVIWVTVLKERVIRQIQNEVSQRLKLDIKNDESDDIVASKLFNKLKQMKYLLLLDDVRNKVELEKVGIPSPNEANGCKVILTTRSLGVCNEMRTDKEINVPVLSEDEAWELFCTNVGAVVSEKSIKTLAKDIIKECGGLPLLINVVGETLRKEKDIRIWSGLLADLKSPATSNDDKLELVFKVLKVSYDRLKGAHTKECFFYDGDGDADADADADRDDSDADAVRDDDDGGDGDADRDDGDGNTGITIPVEIMDVVKNADPFILKDHKRVQYLSEFGFENLKRLKHCIIENCKEMKGMIDAGDDVRSELVGVLSNLEILLLRSLSQLTSVWVGKMPSVGSFSSLRQLQINYCDRIKWVFPITMIQQLSNLEDLTIAECREMEAIFDAEEKDGIVYELPKLKILMFGYLQKLDRIGTGGVLLSCPSLQELAIRYCPISESLIVNTPPNLRVYKRW